MPWLETRVEDERVQFVAEWLRLGEPRGEFAELCRQYGVSRKTGYKWLERYASEGAAGLADRSRRPHSNARALSPETVELLLAQRSAQPTWGARKLRRRLAELDPQAPLPAASTIGDLLLRHGLVRAARKRRRASAKCSLLGLTPMEAANDVWCADFKGWWLCADGQRCEPFTLIDGASRFLLRCQAVEHKDAATVQRIFEGAFGELGCPGSSAPTTARRSPHQA